ncbi:MAG TPA: hypothetical protein VKB12_20510 [Pyrinomonadaceae bacterium]|nr:hypothetical protein [Pyrinomonadaceae bacterium]
MYDNLERHGVEAQKNLYADPGDKVIDVYVRSKAAGKTADPRVRGGRGVNAARQDF